MNLSNEKNTLLNTVSRLAVDFGARAASKFVTRGAMAAAALTVGCYALIDSSPAIATCNLATATADNQGVICTGVAGGFDSDGYDDQDIDVRADAVVDFIILDPGAGEANNSNDNTILVFDIDPSVFGGTNPGYINNVAGDGILIQGDDNIIRNGAGKVIGGGTIKGSDDGIQITGSGNEVYNANNGFDGPAVDSGVITGGGSSGSDGILVSGGTSTDPNIINNGLVGTKTAYIISGGNFDGDDGIDADGWTTVNNGKLGEIHGEDRGIEFSGAAGSTLTVDNDGKIIGDQEDGIVIQSSNTIVNYTGGGTISGGREVGGTDGAGIDIGSGADNVKLNVTFDKGGLIEGYTHGIEVGPNGDNNILVIKGEGTVEGDGNTASDGIHVFDDSTGNFITIDDGALIQGEDDGIFLGSGNKLLVTGGSTVQGDTDKNNDGDGIEAIDDNEIHVTDGSKVIGDPGILANDGNKITIDGGADVTGDPEDGINVGDDNVILIGGAGGAGTVYGKGDNSDGISLTDGIGGGTGSADDNSVTIGNGGLVDANCDGIVVGNVDVDNDDNSIVIQSGGNVIAGRDGIVVNGQGASADDNTVTIDDGGEVNATGDGVRLLGDSIVTNVFDALAGGGPVIFGDADGTGNDLVNDGIIRAGGDGVLVSNTNSDVDNSGGEIYAGEDGVRFTTLHTDEADGDGGGKSESGYQSDSDSVIVAGRDGIHYDNYADDFGDADANHVNATFDDVNGLGQVDVNLLNVFPIIKGYFPEVVKNEGVIEAQRHGISVNDDFDVTNFVDGVIVAGGLDGKGSSGGDGIHADANNTITNYGIIASGADAGGPGSGANGIEVTGQSNTIVNEGIIDTRGDTVIDEINNTTYELGAKDAQDNGAGEDGIHATVDGLSLKGFVDGYDQQTITNNNVIIAADDGIDVKSGGFGPGLEQIITNDEEATITANDDGIVAKHYNIIVNEEGGVINADDDDEGGGDGINVGHSNVVTNDGVINAGLTGNGIVMDGQKGPFSFGNLVTNNGTIDAGLDGIQVNGEQNYIENAGGIIKGGVNGVALNDEENDFVSIGGTIEGGTGAGIYSNEDNDIELSSTTKVLTTLGKGGDGIVLDDDNSLEIEGGLVTVKGDNDGIVLTGDDNDVDFEGDGVNGVAELSGRTGDALRIEGDSNTFDSSDALDLQGGDDGIHIAGNVNSVDIDGNVGGEDDGIFLDSATGNIITVDGNVLGDTDGKGGGDGVDITGGGNNVVTVFGVIGGDPGVIISNSNNNDVSGAAITGTQGGVVISNGNNNTVASTNGSINGDLDDDGIGHGVAITGKSNLVTSTGSIVGEDAVVISGNLNEVSATGDIEGSDEGVEIAGNTNVVSGASITGEENGVVINGSTNTVSTTDIGITGVEGNAVDISGNNNVVSSASSISGGDFGVTINGSNNSVEADGDILSDQDGGGFGSGVDIDGNNNSVSGDNIGNATSGEDGVRIDGNSNIVTANGDIDGYDGDGVIIFGDDNTVSGEDIASVNGGGIDINGDGNNIDADNVTGGGTGVEIDGDSNSVSSASIDAGIYGVQVSGDNNTVSTGAITASYNGVDLTGDSNNVDASSIASDDDGFDIDGDNNSLTVDNDIVGDANQGGYGSGGFIFGNNNTVSAGGSIYADTDGEDGGDYGVYVEGANNTVTAGQNIFGWDNEGVYIDGDGNAVTAGGQIASEYSNGVSINGNSNDVGANGIAGGNTGAYISGNNNTIDVGEDGITGQGGNGVDIFGLGNEVFSDGAISGDANGVIIGGINNSVVAFGDITGEDGDGVNISGNNNSVAAAGEDADIAGIENGVQIEGSNNTVVADDITGEFGDGVVMEGDNNTIEADGNVSGGDDGVSIFGDSNDIDVDGSITGTGDDGIAIEGDNNTIDSGTVTGADDGVAIVGINNIVKVTGDINGDSFPGAGDGIGDGVDIKGSGNTVSASGSINGDPGVVILGSLNNVVGGDINGLKGGAIITGNQNNVASLDDIATVDGFGVGITGNQNTVFAVDDISSTNNDGVNIAGNQNQVSANDIYGGIDGIQINGNQNFVDAAATVTGLTGNGVHFDSGTGNNVDLTNVTVTAGKDGILVDVDGNEFQHNSNTVINAGDDGIEYEYGGLVNAYESLVWLGTINAADDGIVADSGFFTIINNGTINADTDKNSDGNGITVTSDNTVENNGTITGWNGIVGDDRNDILNDGKITVTNDGIVVDDDNKVINNGTITAGDDGIVADDNNVVINNGTINAGDDGIDVNDYNYVENNSSLTINADDNGIEAGDFNEIINNGVINADFDDSGDGDGINANDDNEITNNGIITGWNGIVVDDRNEVTNNGEIDVKFIGIVGEDQNTIVNIGDITAGDHGVGLNGDDNSVSNSGTIDAGHEGVDIEGDRNSVSNSGSITADDDGVDVSGDDNDVDNTGSITAADDGVDFDGDRNSVSNSGTITADDDGVDFSGDDNSLNNTGSITADDNGVDIFGEDNVVSNSGSITGGDNGVEIGGEGNSVSNSGSITGGDDGVEIGGEDNVVSNTGSITGEDDGIDINGDDNYVSNSGTITGEDDGIEVNGNNTDIDNASDGASIWGQEGNGIDIDNGSNTDVHNHGSITGYWNGIENDYGNLYVDNHGGTITGQNGDGINSNQGSGYAWTEVENYSDNYSGEDFDHSQIVGKDDGIDVGGEGLYVYNGEDSLIQGQTDDGIHTTAFRNEIYNDGTIIGAHTGITDGSNFGGEDWYANQHSYYGESTYIVNGSTGVIEGSEAGYLFQDGEYYDAGTVQIDNFGVIEATGNGVLPTPDVVDGEDIEAAAVNLDMINGEDADPVAAIDTSDGPAGLEVFIFNWGTIQGANEFSAEIPDDPDTEANEFVASKQLTNRFAILGGEGSEYIANFAGGTINGDIATQAGDDVLALEIGSTLNGDADLGQTLINHPVLTAIKDDPATKDVDESNGGTAYEFAMSATPVDMGIDTVVLFGTGVGTYSGDITEAEVLYVDDMLTQADVYEVGPESGYLMAAALGQPVLENQPFPAGTWNLNGNVTVDGAVKFALIDIDTDGDGETDETVAVIDGTVGTVVNNGRLNIGGSTITEIPGEPTEDPDDEESALDPSTYELSTNSTAVLNSPVVDVLSGGILGGHGTIVTNPGAAGGNGGVNLTGAVQGDITTILNPHDLSDNPTLPSEARGALIVGTTEGDLVTQDEAGKVTDATKGDGIFDFKIVAAVDEESDPTVVDLLYTVDDAGKLYPTVTLPAGWVEELGPSAFDFTTDSPRYATLAPGDEITRIGTLTVYGNVTMDGRETATTNYVIAVPDDPETEEDESLGGTATTTQAARTVVTNWGSQFQADLKDDGKGDLLLVKKTGVTSAITGSTFDVEGPGPVDLITQDEEGTETAGEPDGVNDFEIEIVGEDITKTDILVAGEGGPDGVPDGVSYKSGTVLDGAAIVDGRLDIRLDGEFVDLVDNSQPAMIDDPEGPTGCGDDPDGADSCPQVPNPLYAIPDGIADVDSKGIAKNNADFSQDAKVWDIIVAEGGVTGKFDEKGFDGGPNDGAVVVRYDDPETPEDEEARVQLLKAYLQYLPDRVRIISIPNFEPKGETLNQTLTGEYLDSLTQYGLNEDALHAAIALVGTATDIPAALDALHPEWYNAFNEVGFSIARGAEHQAYIRTIEAQGFSGGQQNRVVMNVGDDSAVGSSANDRRATFWLAGSWGNASIDDGSNEGWLEYKYESLTGYAGFDYLINPNFLIGIMGGFGNTDVDARNGSGNEGDVDSWQVSGYVSYFTQSWFLNAGGGIGDMNIESIRNINFGSGIGNVSQIATADYDGDITFFYGKGGYSFDLGASGWKLSPELALSYVKVKQDGFSEGGTGNAPVLLLDVNGQSVESLRGTAQLRLSKTFMAGNGGGWMPYARVGIANEFEDELRPITAGFQGAPGTDFTVFGKVPRGTTVIFGAGVSGKVNEMFSLYLDYAGEIGGSFGEHTISGGVRLSF